jgi:hypothetical protein
LLDGSTVGAIAAIQYIEHDERFDELDGG